MAYDIEKTFNSILLCIEEGQSLRSVLKREGMPTTTTFYEWIDKDEQKSLHYARACESRSELKFESIEQDYMEEPQRDPVSGKIDAGWVQLQRLKIDSKKWELGKLQPKKYGDKIQTELSGAITTNIISLGAGIKPE
jgi:hypothetical protein